MNKTDTLYSWLGTSDLNSFEKKDAEHPGPLAHAVLSGRYRRIRILSNWRPGREGAYIPWLLDLLKSRGETPGDFDITLRNVEMTDPTDFTEIYRNLSLILKENRKEERRTYHLSPGTPAMSSIWIILSSGEFPASLISTSLEKGLKEVVMPFNIKADFVAKAFAGLEALDREKCFSDIICDSPAMGKVIADAVKIASFRVPVLIFGESGTGKELISGAIHKASGRNGRFIAVNCGAIPVDLVESEFFGHKAGSFTGAVSDRDGFLKQADGGTIFLDEIGELPLSSQVKLLRALNDSKIRPVGSASDIPVDIRIIAATNKDLPLEVREGRFREDLFHRLAVGIIRMPPLRKRGGDLLLLIRTFIDEINRQFARESFDEWTEKTLSDDAAAVLCSHAWPGNVRELKNTLTRLVIWADGESISGEEASEAILSSSQPPGDQKIRFIPPGFDLKKHLEEVKRNWLLAARDQSRGNMSRAARLLGIDNYQTLDNWYKKLGIKE